MFDRVAVIGTGLIGGSFAAALRKRRLAGRVVGHAPDDAAAALAAGLVDEVAPTVAAAVGGADLVVLAAPVSVNAGLLPAVAQALGAGALVTDVSSVKGPIVAAARAALGAAAARFVGSHPIAGSERSGPAAADAALFAGRTVVLSPVPETAPQTLARVDALWRALGATTLTLEAAEHDRIYALVSHWPHAVAFALAGQLAAALPPGGGDALAGAGLRDMTRIAASSPGLWADILLQNAEQALAAADGFRREAARIEAAIRDGDRDALVALIAAAAQWRGALG